MARGMLGDLIHVKHIRVQGRAFLDVRYWLSLLWLGCPPEQRVNDRLMRLLVDHVAVLLASRKQKRPTLVDGVPDGGLHCRVIPEGDVAAPNRSFPVRRRGNTRTMFKRRYAVLGWLTWIFGKRYLKRKLPMRH